MNFENSLRLDIAHSKTINDLSFVPSVTLVEEARYVLNSKSLRALTTYKSRPSDNQRHLLDKKKEVWQVKVCTLRGRLTTPSAQNNE
jgi:hypothetical protein